MNYPKNRYRGKKPWMSRDWLYYQYITLDKSSKSIANEYGCKQNTIQQWLLKHSIKKNITKHEMVYAKPYQKRDYLFQRHIIDRLSLTEIARENNVSYDVIAHFVRKYEIDYWVKYPKQAYTEELRQCILSLYFEDKLSANRIAKLLHASHRTIIDIIRSYGHQSRSMQEAQFNYRGKEVDQRINDISWLNKCIQDDGLTARDIADILGCSPDTIRRQLKKFDLKLDELDEIVFDVKSVKSHVPNSLTSLTTSLREYFRVNIRPNVLYRDAHKCTVCGIQKNLHVHHIYPFEKIVSDAIQKSGLNIDNMQERILLYKKIRSSKIFNDMSNVTTLCGSCHRYVHCKDNQQPNA